MQGAACTHQRLLALLYVQLPTCKLGTMYHSASLLVNRTSLRLRQGQKWDSDTRQLSSVVGQSAISIVCAANQDSAMPCKASKLQPATMCAYA